MPAATSARSGADTRPSSALTATGMLIASTVLSRAPPSAPPEYRDTLGSDDATPRRSSGTSWITVAVTGAVEAASPRASTTMPGSTIA
jgi:hypothetical protein